MCFEADPFETDPMALPVLADVLPRFEGLRVYRLALTFDGPLVWEQYETLMGALVDIHETAHGCLPFWVGDLLNEVEFRRGETYAQLIGDMPFDSIGMLRNYKWVCGRVPPVTRFALSPRGDVTYTLCRLVAPLETLDERKRVLEAALANGWSTRDLEQWMRTKQPGSVPPREDLGAWAREAQQVRVGAEAVSGWVALDRAALTGFADMVDRAAAALDAGAVSTARQVLDALRKGLYAYARVGLDRAG